MTYLADPLFLALAFISVVLVIAGVLIIKITYRTHVENNEVYPDEPECLEDVGARDQLQQFCEAEDALILKHLADESNASKTGDLGFAQTSSPQFVPRAPQYGVTHTGLIVPVQYAHDYEPSAGDAIELTNDEVTDVICDMVSTAVISELVDPQEDILTTMSTSNYDPDLDVDENQDQDPDQDPDQDSSSSFSFGDDD